MRRVSVCMQRLATASLVLALGILLPGCRLLSGGTPQPAPQGTWQLTSGVLDGAPIPLVAGSEPTLTISGSDVGGRAGCNIYGGTATFEDGRVTISALSMTEMACDEERMAEEAAYSTALGRVDAFELAGDRLTLRGGGAELSYERVPPVADADLIDTTWLLQSVLTGDATSSVVGEPAILSFGADGQLSGSTGCRTFSGTFTRAENAISVGSLVTDDRGCSEETAAQDAHVLGVLEGMVRISIDGSQLTLTADDGTGLGYQAELPD